MPPLRQLATSTQAFATTASAARWARRHASEVLERWDVPELSSVAVLVVSELVTNAYVHSGGGSGAVPLQCLLTLRLFPDVLGVEVWDPNPVIPAAQRVDVSAESGRGMRIVAALTKRLMVVPGRDGGKTVIAVIAREAR